MIRKLYKVASVIISFTILISSCKKIDEPESEFEQAETTTDTEIESLDSDENTVTEQTYKIDKNEFYMSYQFEKGIYTGELSQDAVDYEGDGFIQLKQNDTVMLKLEIPYSQHYKLSGAFETDEAAVALSVNSEQQDSFYINETIDFQLFSCNGVYLEKGSNIITIKCLRGNVKADYLTLENYELFPRIYSVLGSVSTPNPSLNTIGLMKYLSSVYGKKTLTSQYCSPNTNAEIDMIYSETEVYPAIRCGDLMYYSYTYDGDKSKNKEIELAQEWSKKGGIVSFSWHWYAPDDIAHYYTERTGFSLDEAVVSEDYSKTDIEAIDALYELSEISDETYGIIRDIDQIAEQLKILADNDIPVIWRPLMQAGGNWFWWNSCKSESYIWLWKLMFNRLTSYHGLNNLIWVWSGDNAEFYPGDEYVDIIGQDIYNTSKSANSSRFSFADSITINKKPVAMTECATVPNLDILSRDDSIWLWFSVWSGEYIIGDDGKYSEKYTKWQQLYNTYHHEKSITLDDIPDFKTFGLVDG